MFTVRNTCIVAIMQVGVIVAGSLAAGLCHKFCFLSHIAIPAPAALLYSYGVFGFVIPLTWGVIALLVERQPKLTDDFKDTVFVAGIVILILLIAFVLVADITPWLHGTWTLGKDDGG
jgi:hypothetical protein